MAKAHDDFVERARLRLLIAEKARTEHKPKRAVQLPDYRQTKVIKSGKPGMGEDDIVSANVDGAYHRIMTINRGGPDCYVEPSYEEALKSATHSPKKERVQRRGRSPFKKNIFAKA